MGKPLSQDGTELHPVIRLKVIVAINRHNGEVRGSSHRCLIRFLEPKMQDLPYRSRRLRQEIGAVIKLMMNDGELKMQHGRWLMSGAPAETRRPRNRRSSKHRGRRYFDDRSYHGRPRRDRRFNRVPSSTTVAA